MTSTLGKDDGGLVVRTVIEGTAEGNVLDDRDGFVVGNFVVPIVGFNDVLKEGMEEGVLDGVMELSLEGVMEGIRVGEELWHVDTIEGK